jgi:chemotaxis protein MotB
VTENTSDRKKEEVSKEGGVPHWIVTYSDLITLMLAFFVMLVSFGTFEKGKIVGFIGSFEGAFKILPRGLKTDPAEQVMEPGQEIPKTFSTVGTMVTKMQGLLHKEGIKQGVEFKTTVRGLEITLAGYSIFGLQPQSADIAPEIHRFLDEITEVIKETSCLVSIEGHTDDIPPGTSAFASHWDLSTARAVAVLRYFLERGVSPLRLSAEGCGEHRPLAPNDTAEGRAQNRRVIIYLQPNQLEDGRAAEHPLFKDGIIKTL